MNIQANIRVPMQKEDVFSLCVEETQGKDTKALYLSMLIPNWLMRLFGEAFERIM